MNAKKQTVLFSVLIGLIIIAFLSLFIGFLVMAQPEDDSASLEHEVEYSLSLDPSESHSTPELLIDIAEDSAYYLRIKKTPKPKKQEITLPTIPSIEPVLPVEPIVVEAPIIEEIPVIEEIIIPESLPEPIPVEEPEVVAPMPIEEPAIEEEVYYQVETYDDDFWADFFVQGEDEFILDAGYYYMALYVNENYEGEIEVYIENEYLALSMAQLQAYTSEYLTEEANQKLFEGQAEYLTPEELLALGVEASIDTLNFAVYVNFNNDDMPWNVISVAGLDKKVSSRPIVGAENLEKEPFAATSHITASFNGTLRDKSSFGWNLSASISNELSIYDYYLDFLFSLFARNSGVTASFRGWKIYREFEEHMLRLDAGNVSTSMLSPYGTSLGISIKKDFSHAKVGTKRANVHETTILVETDSLITITNDDKKVFERTLKPGNYKLEDFILFSGLNTIVVTIEPLNGSEKTELLYEFSYSSSLLAPKERYYGASIAFGREQLLSEDFKRDGALSLKLGKKIYQYDIRNFAISGFYNVGLTKSMTLNSSFAFSNTPDSNKGFVQNAKLSLDLYAANPLGVLKTQANISLKSGAKPWISLKAGQQIPFESIYFRNLNLSLSYSSPAQVNGYHNLSLSASSSGKITKDLTWNGGVSLAYHTTETNKTPYSISAGLSWNPRSTISISANATIAGAGFDAKPSISARISGYISFGDAGTASATVESYSTNLGYRVNRDSLSISADVSMPGLSGMLVSTPSDYGLDVSIGDSYDAFSISGNLYSTLDANEVGISAAASTNILYAGGAFGISSASPSKYLLVKQDPALSSNSLSISMPGVSKSENPNRLFSTYLYTNLSKGYLTSLELYSYNEQNSFLGIVNKTITIPADKRGAYVYYIEADKSFHVSAMMEIDDYVYSNESSPVYNVLEAEDGTISLETNNNMYVFTDQTGRFVLSEVVPGTYAFDLRDLNNDWNLIIFDVTAEDCAVDRMNLFEVSAEYKDGSSLDYKRVIKLDYNKSLSEEEYWAMVDAEWEEAL